MPRAGSARALTAGDVHDVLEQLADVVHAVRDAARIRARPDLGRDVRPLVFAGNCLWAAANAWQEHEALADLRRAGSELLEIALRMRAGAGGALDAAALFRAALFRAEHALRALVATATPVSRRPSTPPHPLTQPTRAS